MKGILALAAVVGGNTCFAYGLWCIYEPLSWLFLGAELILFGVGIVRQDQKKATAK